MMMGARTFGQRMWWALLMGVAIGAGALLFAGTVRAKPASPPQPTWRTLNQELPRPKSGGRKKRAKAARTQAEEPAAAAPAVDTKPANTPEVASPPPDRKPEQVRAPESVVEKDTSPGTTKLQERLGAPPASSETPSQPGAGDATAPKEAEKSPQPEKSSQPEQRQSAGDKAFSKQYCNNIANAAADARFAWQKKALLQTEQDVAKRVEELNVKIAEYEKWLARREEFSRKAQAAVVGIYTKMKPDAAALQITALEEEMAAAVIAKLDTRSASAIMNEMEPKHAARLAAIIAGAAKGPGKRPPASAAPASKDRGT